ncbi:MAG: alkaline phosphatase D family protein [Alphaproteobacteria bacterium]|nr:alkaline phosphatase D family protein [Alphaproteobacteria bacterium]
MVPTSLPFLASLVLGGCRSEPATPPAPPPKASAPRQTTSAPPLVAVGDVRPQQAILQVDAGDLSRVMVEAWIEGSDEDPWRIGPLEPTPPPKAPTVQTTIEGLPPGSAIGWRVRTGDGREATGRFRTPPLPDTPAPVRLAVAGDLAGQGWCRPADPGRYAIFDGIQHAGVDVVVFNGDMIYADNSCPTQDPGGGANLTDGHPGSVMDVDWTDRTAVRAVLDGWWRYNRSDPALQELLASTSIVAQWDDHEAVNDFGGGWDTWHTGDPDRPGYRVLVEEAHAAFLAWNPVAPADPARRIERRLRWGHHAELFVADARSHRSDNRLPDGPDKTMLGREQLGRLIEDLAASDATWKIVSVDVPMSIPTGSAAWKNGRDGWASGTGAPDTPEGETDISAQTGFERELGELLGAIHDRRITGVVFVTTDVHHSRLLRYDNGGVPVHEVVSGPLRAWSGAPWPLDPTFAPQELYAEGERFTFAHLDIDADGGLTITIRDEQGEARPGGLLTLPAPTAG